MNPLGLLEKLLTASTESENLEFKAAENQYGIEDVLKYCVALSNEGGGHLVLGVKNAHPKGVAGTRAFGSKKKLNDLKLKIFNQLRIRVDIDEVKHPDGRVLIFKIPPRPTGQPLDLDGRYLMRAGESVVPMTPDRLKEIFAESSDDWFTQTAAEVSDENVAELLDTRAYFRLCGQPYPSTVSAVLERLENECFIQKTGGKWSITHLGAIVLAKDLQKFPPEIYRKMPRFVLYDGVGKTGTREDVSYQSGYAAGFEGLVNLVHSRAPRNRILEDVIRAEQQMFPKQALRELIANALIHQDFSMTGASVMVEMYADRVEISSPGKPIIDVDRFIDNYRSRNEMLADVMRRLGICEEKGSGIDKVIGHVERSQLPAPSFRGDEIRTTVTLFAHANFSDMSKVDRIRACYQHCCLRFVDNRQMTNSSLRARFGLNDTPAGSSLASQIIAATKKSGLIKPKQDTGQSLRYASYLPFWA